MQNTYSEIDGIYQGWFRFFVPMTVGCGDILNIQSEDAYISWFINESMIIIGHRLDGWLIDHTMSSVPYNSIARNCKD